MAYQAVDPNAKLSFANDWSDYLPSGVTISSRQWSIAPTSGSPDEPSLTNDTSATVTVTGFTLGEIYVLTEKVTLSNGEIDERSTTLRCEDTQ